MNGDALAGGALSIDSAASVTGQQTSQAQLFPPDTYPIELLFQPPSDCRQTNGLQRRDDCLALAQQGVTRLSVGEDRTIVETDVAIDEALLEPNKTALLRETIVHELGHSYGLPHLKVVSGKENATMMTASYFGVSQPTARDKALFRSLYGHECR